MVRGRPTFWLAPYRCAGSRELIPGLATGTAPGG
jgi:hypothetical protein